MTYRLPIRDDVKRKPPDWPIQPYVPRSADEYERHNEPKPERKK